MGRTNTCSCQYLIQDTRLHELAKVLLRTSQQLQEQGSVNLIHAHITLISRRGYSYEDCCLQHASENNCVQHGAHALHNIATHHLLHFSFQVLLGIHLAYIRYNTLFWGELLLLQA